MFALPKLFEQRLQAQLGAEMDAFRKSLQQPHPISIRLNPKKKYPAPTERIAWCHTGYYLPQRPVFTLDPALHAGAYYVQEASSMFLEEAVRQLAVNRPLRVLDLCAAPGGKSTHLLSLLHPESLMVTNEVIKSRASILSENIQKWGYANVVVTHNDPADFAALPAFFDLMLIDAPCSGEGLFRKEPDAMNEWSEDNVQLCAARQKRIVSDAWPALREDGSLVYCTCTYSTAENEENLVWMHENYLVEFVELENLPEGIEEVRPKPGVVGYRLYPHRLQGEGFFLSVMRKKEAQEAVRRKFSKDLPKASLQSKWLPPDFHLQKQDDLVIGWPATLTQDILLVSERLHAITKGVAMATVKHNKWIPEHALALSVDLNRSEFAQIEVTKEQAIQYLRKDTLSPFTADKGFALVVYEGNALGWINQLGSRVNNLYPSNWRIRMEAGASR